MAKPTRLTQEMIDEYVARGLWSKDGIDQVLRQNALEYPNKEAIVDSKRRLTWSELDNVVDRVALGLMRRGIERDQALIAQIPSSTTSIILLLACHRAGILCCLAPLTFRQKEMAHLFKTLGAAAVLTPERYRDLDFLDMVKNADSGPGHLRQFFVTGEEAPLGAFPFKVLETTPIEGEVHEADFEKRAFGPFEVSSIVLSSGTTGMPKCIEHTGASSLAGGRGVVMMAELTREEVMGNIAPLSGGPGLQNWWACLQIGARMCLLERFTPDGALDLIQRERVTYLSAIPTQLVRILKECDLSKYDLSPLRIVRTGAAALDASLGMEIEQKLSCKVLVAGGSQETYSFAQSGVNDTLEKRIKTLGRPFPGNEIKIGDENGNSLPPGQVGELYVRGASTSSGYYGDRDATLAAWGALGKEGWYNTGDLAKIDEDGFLVLVGRKKEIIIRGGQNIYPKEIEELLCTHPKVVQAVVLGVPDTVMGERACACVVLAEGEKMELGEMTDFLRNMGLAVHKLPERLEIFEKFPQLAEGQKVDRRSLKEQVLERLKG
ncbi:MAG: acyl--CoA ligase [Deltaproteobacteria bacterium]|nr:acyl--CoA ligase [Deltaproteobacteria bacterium]